MADVPVERVRALVRLLSPDEMTPHAKRMIESVCEEYEESSGLAPSVTVEEIARQRAAGWPDFHPEAYCHRCGQRNVKSWFADSSLWAEAYAALGDVPDSDILCPQCFTEGIEKARGEYVTWEVKIGV